LVWLSDDDQRKLHEQGWDGRADFAGQQVMVREGWLKRRWRLAQRPDGSCVFLMPDGRCRVHAEYGAEAKPLVCRMFPLQLVPQEKHAWLTLRRACPTAAADRGRAINEYRALASELGRTSGLLEATVRPPHLTRRQPGSWEAVRMFSGSLDRLLTDPHVPLVRRIAHGLRFCTLLESCRIRGFDAAKLRELCTVLEEAAHDVGTLFEDRQPPGGAAQVLFRQTAAEYVRLHPTFRVAESWRERWRMARVAVAMARGKGTVPPFHPGLPETTFEALDRPLGHLEENLQRPFLHFFIAQVASLQFALASRPGWPIVESLRALAIAYPVGLWLLRWLATNEGPKVEHVIDIVTMLDRGQGYAPLLAGQHRARISALARLGDLDRLVVWYAR
jgi:lysine-N-methylase